MDGENKFPPWLHLDAAEEVNHYLIDFLLDKISKQVIRWFSNSLVERLSVFEAGTMGIQKPPAPDVDTPTSQPYNDSAEVLAELNRIQSISLCFPKSLAGMFRPTKHVLLY